MKTMISYTHLPHLVTATIVGTLALACTAMCSAADSRDVPHAVVKFGDLSLSSPNGADALYRRIYAAAYEVCASSDTDKRDLLDLRGLDACVHDTVRDAVAKVNQPALSAIYNARNRDPLPITLAGAHNR